MDNTQILGTNYKSWYQSRTIWLAIVTAISGILVTATTQYPDIGWMIVAKAAVDIVVRLLTSQPIN